MTKYDNIILKEVHYFLVFVYSSNRLQLMCYLTPQLLCIYIHFSALFLM